VLRHIWDGWNEGFAFIRSKGGVQTTLCSVGTSDGTGLNPTGVPTTMSITLENKTDRVKWTIRYGGCLVQSGEDTSADRITSGAGVGLEHLNNGTPDWTSCSFDNLSVAAIIPLAGPGDANDDGKVDVSDLGILAANYGRTSGATWGQGDFNGDGKVDVSDLGILAAHYGAGTGSTLDFNKDAKAMGLMTGNDEPSAKEETPSTSALGCGAAGLPLIAGIFLMGFLFLRLDE
jgi:hypothetical protein